MISINIINYNSEEYIDLFVPSLDKLEGLNQEYEIVLVDNFSEDESWNELKDIADIAVRYESNRGEARDMCLKICNGDWVVDQIDPDQYITDNFCKVMNRYIELDPDWVLNTDGCMMSKKGMIKSWPHKQRGEDKEIWLRKADEGKLRYLAVNTVDHEPSTYSGDPGGILHETMISEEEFFEGKDK